MDELIQKAAELGRRARVLRLDGGDRNGARIEVELEDFIVEVVTPLYTAHYAALHGLDGRVLTVEEIREIAFSLANETDVSAA